MQSNYKKKQYSIMNIKLMFVVILIFFFDISFSQDLETSTGEYITKITNGKDIYHFKNKLIRKRMQLLAIIDAIEKGATIKIESKKTLITGSYTIGGKETTYEEFMMSIQTKHKVIWQRTSNYEFEKLGNRKWKVSVAGLVKNATDKDDLEPFEFDRAISLSGSEDYVIERRSYNKVFINIGKDKVRHNKGLVVSRDVLVRTIGGGRMVSKPKALLKVEQVNKEFTTARIVKGFWNVKKGDVVSVRRYNKSRSGFELNFFEYRNNSPVYRLSALRTNYYFQSYNSRLGFSFGCEFSNYSPQRLLANKQIIDHLVFIPNMGLNYYVGLIPDFLYLSPSINVGYIIPEKEKQFPSEAWKIYESYKGTKLSIKPSLNLFLRIKFMELGVGYTYHLLNDLTYLDENYYPSFSVRFNLRRSQ